MRTTSCYLVAVGSIVSSISCIDDACDSEDCTDDTALMEQAYDANLFDPKADGSDCSGVRFPDRAGFDKRIALTFDDGPNPTTTPQVIAVLKAHRAPATFFTNGSRYSTQAAIDLASEIAADPDYILANHSHNHINLAQQSATKVASEIDGTDLLIRAAGETPKYFRFPFGSANCSAVEAVRSRGYMVTGWHVDSADWCFAAGGGVCKESTFKYVPDDMRSDMQRYVLSQVRANNGGVILFHDIHQSTADRLDAILTSLEAEGFVFVRLDDTGTFPKLHGAMAPQARFIGDDCTTQEQCKFTAAGKEGRCHPAGFCTLSCEGSCPDLADRAPTFCIADPAVTSTGICVSRAVPKNALCAALPGTTRRDEQRFVVSSNASPAHALVCAPR